MKFGTGNLGSAAPALIWACLGLALMLLRSGDLEGQRRVNTFTPGVSVIGRMNADPPRTGFYGVYPSVTIGSIGRSSNLRLSYAFGRDLSDAIQGREADSHHISGALRLALGRDWDLDLNQAFSLTSDPTSFNAYSGVRPPDVPFEFVPVSVSRRAHTNRTNLSVVHRLTSRSTISFTPAYWYRTYDGGNSLGGALSDSRTASVGLNYSQQFTQRDTWSVGFTSARTDFTEYADVSSHSVYVGYTRELATDLLFQATVGASRTRNLGTDWFTTRLNTRVRLQKTFEDQMFSISYVQAAGEPSGLGSASDTRRLSFRMRQTLATLDFDVNMSAFEASGALGNPFSNKGTEAIATVGRNVVGNLSVRGGGQFQKSTEAAGLNYTRKLFFASVNYAHPIEW